MVTRSLTFRPYPTGCACCACSGAIDEGNMPCDLRRPKFRSRPTARWAMLLLTTAGLGCAGRSGRSPWPAPEETRPLAHAEVTTVNPGYKRLESAVLVRKIARPTRANLDFAAYHANFMIAEPPPEDERQTGGSPKIDRDNLFRGLIDPESLTGSIDKTPLSAEERARPLALAPLAQWLSERKGSLAGGV